jgi:membrane fusion protein, multidrug efflux system
MCYFYKSIKRAIWTLAIATYLVSTSSAVAGEVDSFIEPYRTINVSATEQGIIAKLNVKEGDAVKQGQILAVLDMDVLEASRDIAKAGKEAMGRIKSAEALAILKKERYEKLKQIEKDGHAHPEEVLRAKTEWKIAKADLLTAKEDQKIKELEYVRIESQIERRKIISPIDGHVTKIHKDISEYVAATDPVVLTLVQCDKLKAVFAVPSVEASKFSVGEEIAVNIQGNTETAQGKIESISPVADPESNTVRVRTVIDNSQSRYRSGTACYILIGPSQDQSVDTPSDKNSKNK